MIFRQLFEPDSSTYTYLLSCRDTGRTVLIDPVLDTAERDARVLQKMGLQLSFTLDTHIHADHLTGASKLKELTGSQIAYPAIDELPCADLGVREGTVFRVGQIEIHPLFTPGHTNHHHAYLVDNGTQKMLFSGDALLIESCGRTDFQSGNAETLYRSIHDKIFTLPDDTIIWRIHGRSTSRCPATRPAACAPRTFPRNTRPPASRGIKDRPRVAPCRQVATLGRRSISHRRS